MFPCINSVHCFILQKFYLQDPWPTTITVHLGLLALTTTDCLQNIPFKWVTTTYTTQTNLMTIKLVSINARASTIQPRDTPCGAKHVPFRQMYLRSRRHIFKQMPLQSVLPSITPCFFYHIEEEGSTASSQKHGILHSTLLCNWPTKQMYNYNLWHEQPALHFGIIVCPQY